MAKAFEYDRGVNQTFYLAGTAKSNFPVWLQFPELVNHLNNQGFDLKITFPTDSYIGINHSQKDYSHFLKAGGNPNRAVLILLEPEAVYPSQYKLKVLGKYGLILRPGNPIHCNPLKKFIAWPYESNANPLTPSAQKIPLKDRIADNVNRGLFEIDHWRVREQYLTLINSNKVSPAFKENYSLRRRFAREIEPEILSVYGDLWEAKIWKKIRHRLEVFIFSMMSGYCPNIRNIYGNLHWSYPSSRGNIVDKQEVLQNFKFNIVIENDPSYISEKIFDSMINGCIPIYSGPNIPNEIIPVGSYIALPEIPSQLISTLEALTNVELKRILSQIQAFISSSTFLSVWDKDLVFEHISQEIYFHLEAGNE